MEKSKPRVVKDYDRLGPELQEKVRRAYPFGYEEHLITFYNRKGETVTALPYEDDSYVYLIRMSKILARYLGIDSEENAKVERREIDFEGLELEEPEA